MIVLSHKITTVHVFNITLKCISCRLFTQKIQFTVYLLFDSLAGCQVVGQVKKIGK